MNILRVFNNNVVLAHSSDDNCEIILTGRGIGFQMKPGDTVKQEKISDSGCVRKLASMGLDKYSVTIGETTYRVSLRDGILKQQRSPSSFMSNINKMMEKVKTARPEIPVKTVTVQTPTQQTVVIDVDNKRKMAYHGKCS